MEILASYKQDRVPVTVFHLKGNLTEDERLLTRVREVVEASTRYLLLDLTEVPYVNSRGLQALHRIYTLLRSNGDDVNDEEVRAGLRSGTYKSPHLKLLNPPKDVMKVLSLAGYDEFLEIHRNRKKAVASF